MNQHTILRSCLREPIPAIFDAARYLDAAVSAHLAGQKALAAELLALANAPLIWSWTDSIWGKNSIYVSVSKLHTTPTIDKAKERMPSAAQKAALHQRDGFHCRFCGIPVIRAEIRKAIQGLYPDVVPWGRSNTSQHAAFQCMWAQYDHVVPHAHGGGNALDNLVITCAACNYGKMNYTLEQLGLKDPRMTPPVKSFWDGLERIMVPGNAQTT